MLELKNIHMRFASVERSLPVLDDISFSVKQGEFAALVGPSGCGKTTLFKIIGGLLLPTAGNVCLNEREITGEKGHISYIPQENTLFPWRNVEQNAILGLEVAGVGRAEALNTAQKWLPRLGLAEYGKMYPAALSGGMQQRVSFLRALVSPQELMCLDEPFGALDALTRRETQQWLLNIWEAHRRSVLLITHSIEEALLLADRVFLLSARPAHLVREFVVPFPRPRRQELVLTPEFINLREEIYNLIGSSSR